MRTLITIDTELSAGLYQQGATAQENFDSSILGRCAAGDFGIHFFMDRLEAYGHIGVFFVDPLVALVYGKGVVADIVGPIVARGHEVQLHIHTEWLEFAKSNPLGDALGRNIGDFDLGDQVQLIGLARDLLMEAGAPSPIAFRAGNYGADDATMRALSQLGFTYDSSFNASYTDSGCDISLPPECIAMTSHLGIIELPITAIDPGIGGLRHAQLCALSVREMRSALIHSVRNNVPHFTIVSHSFELLSRDRKRPNKLVLKRLEALCRTIAEHRSMTTAGFGDLTPRHVDDAPILEPSLPRTLERVAEQAIATIVYERKRPTILPAAALLIPGSLSAFQNASELGFNACSFG